MSTTARRHLLAAAVFAAIAASGSPAVCGEVFVFDQAVSVGSPLTLTVRTTRFFMADGGRVLDLYLGQERLGRVLTGADGYGYFRWVPRRAGLVQISARSDGDRAAGRVRVLEEGERAVLVELETVLKDITFRAESRDACRTALEALSRRFALIYVYRILGAGFSRSRVAAEGLPDSVVLKWNGAATPASLRSRGVQVHAVIGSPDTAAGAGEQVPRRISFEKAKGAETAAGWEDLEKTLE
jgi:hypothetical protein